MRAGEIAHTAVDAVEALEAYYARYLPQRAIASLLPFTILAVVFPLDWISGLVLVLTAVFLPLSMIVIGDEAHERNRRLWAKLALMSGRFLDVLQGLATVRMFGAAAREAQEIERTSNEYRVLTLSVLRVAFLSSFMLELISAVSIAIVAVISGLRLLHGSMSFRPGYFILLIAPEYFLTLRMLGTFYHSRMDAVSAAEQIRAFLETPVGPLQDGQGVQEPHQARARARTPPAVTFSDVHFSYTAAPLLSGVSFSMGAGEHLAVAGPSGAGKSTLFALLLGFAAPRQGSVLIDGLPLGGMDMGEWRSRIAWLPQKPTLFPGTVRDNIVLGRHGATKEEIEWAVLMAHVDEFLARLPDGVDTVIGEGGQGLSVGQRQRVALARLFLRTPSLVLLDEPTAHLDTASALMVTQGIRVLAHGRTTILVSHTPDTIDIMDRLFVLPEGKAGEAT
jgi:ATP-binding cassette subfamily C protein CydD